MRLADGRRLYTPNSDQIKTHLTLVEIRWKFEIINVLFSSIQPQLQKSSIYLAPLVVVALFFVVSLIIKFNWTIAMVHFYRIRIGHVPDE